MSRSARALAAVALTGALVGATAAVPSYAGRDHHPGKGRDHSNNNSVRKLTQAVTVKGVLKHLREFQEISDEYGDRAAGRPGYDASVDYVVRKLRRAGYATEVQEFPFTYIEENSELEQLAPVARSYEGEVEFTRNRFDPLLPPSSATGEIFVVGPGAADSGCTTDQFAGMQPGQIALIQRGSCPFAEKAANADAADAAGVVIWNNAPGFFAMGGDYTGRNIPIVSATQAVGEELAAAAGTQVRIDVDYFSEERTSSNVIAETRHGNPDNIVMAGAHLDSVQDGAGINDNGTGSAAVLEVALKMAKVKPANKVRFTWWGAEEEGLLGAEHYVAQLSEEEAAKIALYLNFDMIGSPNYTFGVYDGDNSGGTAEEGFIPEGSAQIEDVFEKFYTSRREPFVDSEFSGRSDYGPFIAIGIPAGGLFTGAEGRKTEEEAALFGGVAGASYDPCYHEACDNLRGDGQDEALYDQLDEDYRLVGNVNVKALDVNSDAVATAVLTFAYDTSAVNGVVSKPGKGKGPGKGHDKRKGPGKGYGKPGQFKGHGHFQGHGQFKGHGHLRTHRR